MIHLNFPDTRLHSSLYLGGLATLIPTKCFSLGRRLINDLHLFFQDQCLKNQSATLDSLRSSPFRKCWKALRGGGIPVSFASPLVWLCRVWVDLDGSVTVSNGCIWFLHLDEDTEYRGSSGNQLVGGKKPTTIFQKLNTSVTKTQESLDSHLALLA